MKKTSHFFFLVSPSWLVADFLLLEITYILQFHYHLHWVHTCFLVWESVMHDPHFLWELKKRLLLLASRETFQPVAGIARRLSLAVMAEPSGDAVDICVPPLCWVIYHLCLSPSCPRHPNYLLWEKCTELLPNGVCSWKSPVSDVQSSSQAQSNKRPHINGIFLWWRKYIGGSLIFSFLSFQIALRAFFQLSSEITWGGLC